MQSFSKIISIIIPTLDREECWVKLCGDLLQQSVKAQEIEIIIVDQSDAIGEAAKEFLSLHKCIHHVKFNKRNRSAAKNYGYSLSSGYIIIFCDDDIRVPKDFLYTHLENYENDTTIGAVTCRLVEDGWESTSTDKVLKMTFFGHMIMNHQSTWSGYVGMVNGGNMSFRRNVLEKVGGFDELLIGSSIFEETDISFRVKKSKYNIYFDSSITVKHFQQKNGNIALKNNKYQEWFYCYYHNLIYIYLKNRFYIRFFFVLFYVFFRMIYTSTRTKGFIINIKFLIGAIPKSFISLNTYKKLNSKKC